MNPTHIVKEGRLLKLPEVQKPTWNGHEHWWKSFSENMAKYQAWLSSGITISKDLKLEEGKEYEMEKDFRIIEDPSDLMPWEHRGLFAIPVSTELKKEDGVIEKYRKAIDDIYNDGKEGRELVIKYFGLHHPKVNTNGK